MFLSLTTANWVWNWATTDHRGGDGFIAAASQRYPNVPGSPFPPINVESENIAGIPLPAHSGVTRNSRVERVISRELQATFLVRPVF